MSKPKKLVDMAAFRKQKGLKQSEVAKFIETSSSFVSLVETGNAKLPDDKIEKIIKYYGACGLVPCYDRLDSLEYELINQNYRSSIYLDPQFSLMPLEDILTKSVIENIKYGRTEITNNIADKIVAAYPVVNKGWLISGEGDMLYDNTEVRLKSIEDSLVELGESLHNLHQKIDKLMSQLIPLE